MASKSANVPLFVDLDDADSALVKSVTQARRTWPQFLKARTQKQFSNSVFCVKVSFIDRSKTRKQALMRTAETMAKHAKSPICHLWLRVHSSLGDLIFCHVAEAPKELKLSAGTSFVVTKDSIEDWMINRDGMVHGGFSLRVMRKRLSKEEQRKFDAHTGIRAFKPLNL